jgi:hypothetical protein
LVNADLPASGVTANTYGSTTAIPVLTVNAKGVITSATTASITGALVYQGAWNALTNTPTLTSSVGFSGYYYVVSVAGTTNLNGITDWQIGDWAIFNGTVWQKIDQTNTVSSVNGQTGAVSIAYADLAGAIPTWNQNTTGTAAGLSTTLAIGSGGTGQTTAGAAFNALSPITTTGDLILGNGANSATRLAIGANGYLLTSNGTTASWVAAPATGVTSFAAGTTGLTPATATTGAVTLAGTLALANGGSGQTTAQSAINAFAGAVTSGSYLRGNGTNVVMNTIQVADVPTLNQNTTGTAAGLSATLAIGSGGTGQTTAGAAFNALSPITTTGDLILGDGVNSATRLAIGANGYLLSSNGTTASWQPAPAGGVTTFAGGTTGLTPASATSGAISLAGTLVVSNGGTGATTLTGYVKGAGTTALTASSTIPNTDITGLGTMSTQNANSVAVTGGAIDGTTVGATTASTVRATTVTTTGTGSPTDGSGQVYLNGATSNRIDFNTNGTGAPAFTTRSAGTKLVLYPSLSGSVTDYAMGIAAATMWSSVPENNSGFKFKWYGATTEVASLDGAGAFTAVGGISGGTF